MAVYSWAGLGTPASPCQYRTGTQYTTLAGLTGGVVNNICADDWAPKFTKLSSDVITLAYDTISLPQDVLTNKIVRVALNGRDLAETEYSVSPAGLVLSADARKDLVTARLEVEYVLPRLSGTPARNGGGQLT